MKIIQPVSIWYNGKIESATLFNLTSTSDNLVDSAVFYFQLYVNPNFQVADGSITMGGLDYATYCSSADSNSYAYEWAATQLGLEIVGEYVPPVTEVSNVSE